MSKGSFFTGQPIFNQILNLIPRSDIRTIARDCNSDRYCKSFGTYDHLVTMLYAIFNRCDSLREVTTGLLAWDQRIRHLGLMNHPRRSTISDANKRRNEQVFEQIYLKLLKQYHCFLPDSQKKSKKNNLYIFDSTCIALFKDILKASGLYPANGKSKGGIKVHTLLNANCDTPAMIRFSPGADSDTRYLKEVYLPKGSIVIFDRGYCDYRSYNRFNTEGVTFITRKLQRSVYKTKKLQEVNDYQKQQGVSSDKLIKLGYDYLKKAVQVDARLITYKDPLTGKQYEFLTNNTKLAASTIADYYKKRWQIETFFKRIKQNYPVQYFLGDNENAIKIQIWCALIADLLLKVIKNGIRCKMAFSNIIGLVRLHLMTYMDLKSFLQSPEKCLLLRVRQKENHLIRPPLFES